MNPVIFRKYDIRGVVDKDFTLHDAHLIGQSFASYVQAEVGIQPHITVGYDGRFTSPLLEESLISGLLDAGAHVIRTGLGPTPQLYFASHHFQADGAVMVTGSHHPSNYNGFKLLIRGNALFGDKIQELQARILQNDFTAGHGSLRQEEIQDTYIHHLLTDFKTHYPQKNLKIAWDPANGATCEVLSRLLPYLPGEHIVINDHIDGRFPNHPPDPTVPSNLQHLQNIVQDSHCDLGIGFDGDGDRIGIIDAQGRFVWSDQLLTFFAEDILKSQPHSTIIADVKSSQSLCEHITQLGGNPLIWHSGHSLIKAKMKEIGCPLGGELSGHIIFADRYFGYDDAIYAALRLIGILMCEQTSLGQLLDKWPQLYNTSEILIPCTNHDKFAVAAQFKQSLQEQGLLLNDIDGVRITQADGWWMLRPSNTQEALTVRAESFSPQGLRQILNFIEENLASCGMIVDLNTMSATN